MCNFGFSYNTIIDKEAIGKLVSGHPKLYKNESKFVNSLFEFFNGDKNKFIIHYHPLNRLNINNNPEVKLPVYQIQNYKFIHKINNLFSYDAFKPDIEILGKWANDLHWLDEPVIPSQFVNWQNTLNHIFDNPNHFNLEDLSKNFNRIEELILRLDKIFLHSLQNIKTADELFQLVLTFVPNRVKGECSSSMAISYCLKRVPERIKVVCPDKLEQYLNFIEMVFSKTRWKDDYGIWIENRPIYKYLEINREEENKSKPIDTMEIDFQELVIAGYYNEISRKNLRGYFLREFKKAEKEHFFDASYFFDSCSQVIKTFKENLENQINEEKRPFYEALKETQTTDTKRRNQIKEDLKNTIDNIGFTVNITNLTKGKYQTNFVLSDIEKIEKGIKEAFEEVGGLPANENNEIENSGIEVFGKVGYGLFKYLDKSYQQDNNYPIAKYSYIFRFLKPKQVIKVSQDSYRGFIFKYNGTIMSKVLKAENSQKNDDIQSTLKDFHDIFFKKK